MKITWVTRSFLDYRIPVYKALDELCGHQLTIIYNSEAVPERCQRKLKQAIGDRAVAMSGEIRIGNRHQLGVANKGIRIPLQRGLLKRIKQSNPDVLVSDGFFQWTYAPLIIRIFSKKIGHVMCYEKTPHTERNASSWRIKYRRFVSRWIDAIDCNGSLTAQFITETIKFKKILAYGHMAADTSGMARNVEITTEQMLNELRGNIGLRDLTFIYVGRLIPLKGIMELLRAWKAANLKDATLMLVGDGHQRGDIESYINANSLKDSVKLTGAINYDDLGPYYKAADCFIIPTLEDNWSLVVPEAMAAGLPIACSIYNGCHPELVHPENGWTFDPLNLEDTVSTLKTISESRDKLAAMGEESRKIVANHTPQHAAQGIYDACLKVMKR